MYLDYRHAQPFLFSCTYPMDPVQTLAPALPCSMVQLLESYGLQAKACPRSGTMIKSLELVGAVGSER